MKFFTNPFDEELVLDLQCEIFDFNEKVGIHFSMSDDFVADDEAEFVINRTDSSYQTFKLSYHDELEFLEIS